MTGEEQQKSLKTLQQQTGEPSPEISSKTSQANSMLSYASTNTKKYLETMSRQDRKKKGQFFTSAETAEYMANLFSMENVPDEVSILDPGAGTGILSAALVQRLHMINSITKISLTCYETDKDVLPTLKANLDYIKRMCNKAFDYRILEADYLLSQADTFERIILSEAISQKFDFIIGNPPYLRISKNSDVALSMPSVVHGAPNLYFLFASMSLFNLRNNSEMVYIIPRSWTSGAYFKVFREYFLKHGKIEYAHLFNSRDKVFDQVLQETMIVKMLKTEDIPDKITLASSQTSSDFNSSVSISIPYKSVVTGDDSYVFLPTSSNDLNVINRINKYKETMPNIGLRMRTGIIVDFRQSDALRKERELDNCPLFYSQHIKNGRVNHNPSGKEFDWVITSKIGLVQKNKDYIFCKRFTAKEERRRLQCGIYLAADFSEYKYIGTQNKINFIENIDGSDMDKAELYGIFALLNSTLFDTYYRLLNGSTQVNSTEINSIPIPPLPIIKEIGKRLLMIEDLTTSSCDKILSEVAYG